MAATKRQTTPMAPGIDVPGAEELEEEPKEPQDQQNVDDVRLRQRVCRRIERRLRQDDR